MMDRMALLALWWLVLRGGWFLGLRNNGKAISEDNFS